MMMRQLGLHAIFNHAMRWEWHDRNPIGRVRQCAKHSRIPVVLSVVQIKVLLSHLRKPVHTVALVDVSTGLRIGELLALQWQGIDFENFEISVTRSNSLQHIGNRDGSRPQTGSDGCRTRRGSLALAQQQWLSKSGRLVFCQPRQGRETTVLARHFVSGAS